MSRPAGGILRVVDPKELGDAEDEEKPKRGDPVVAKRLKDLRRGLGFKRQVDLAAATQKASAANLKPDGTPRIYPLDQTYISRIETGEIAAQTEHIRGTYAVTLQITRDELADLIDGVLSLDDLRKARSKRIAASPGAATYRRHPRWEELRVAAMELDPTLRPETFERIAETTYGGPPERVTVLRLVQLAQISQSIAGEGEEE